MPDINITVAHKVAVSDTQSIVCDNSDYMVHWTLDKEWSAYDTKTMRTIYMDGTFKDTVFGGDVIALPVCTVPGMVQIGLFAGDIRTSRVAIMRALPSVRSAAGAPADPTPDVYDQLMELIKGLGGADPEAIKTAVAEYLAAHPIEETDPTVPAWAKAETKPTYSAAEVGAIAQSDLQAATDAALAQAKASGEFDGAPGENGADGAPGIYYGTTQPTGDTHPVWIDPNGMPDELDLSLGVTGATVGQIAKIAAVDESGVPTAWEPVDMPTGGGGEKWGLLAEQTLEEKVKAVSMKLSKPTKHFVVQVWCPQIDASENPIYFNLGINGSINNIWYYIMAKLPYKGNTSQLSIEAKSIADNTWAISAYSNVGGGYGTATSYNINTHVPIAIKNNDASVAETVKFEVVTNDPTQYLPVGTVVRVWGVRA